MVWRGPMVTQALTQLLSDTDWGELDYLVVDMPPGTGDIQLTLAQRVPVSGAVIVTTPQDIALLDARKGLRMFQKVDVPVLGIVENMSPHVCSKCGHEEPIFGSGGGARMAEQYGVTCWRACRSTSVSARKPTAGGRRSSRIRTGRIGRAYLDDGAPHGRRASRSAPRRGVAASRRSPSRTPDREHQVRPLDPPHGRRARHDRAVRAGSGARGEAQADHLLRHVELRLRRALRRRVQDLHQHQLDDRRSEGFRRAELRRLRRRRLHHPAEFVRARAHGRVLPHSAQRADDLPRQVAPTRAAASSSTSRRSSPSGKGT